ncbi:MULTISPECIES: metallophosphoesterase family protein [Rhizobium/Agrobacterium group]|uniref:metallophosphoesterase family protein n=1 Tax=Rhizobium/Agrobacterium group TaxID=227290 RepID=UPI0023010741|nr:MULTISPECIES: metallophosphoesterase [Rhizobium/Agrobacterium group]MDA5635070.1 metallophosphoesterase [Agrobacterium sp. ST15.16.024]MDF1890218.1 metallophosphoesterase [Rhizobium rhizogenes]
MLTRALPSVAVIADAHFHDTAADFGFPGIEIDGERITMRSWSDTRESTRVFNESADALHAALEEVRQRGIRHVVLLGDYTDDGQRATSETLKGILEQHRDAHGTAFYALPGNHDIFGPRGRHHTKEFLTENGRCLSVSSDARRAGDKVVISDRMYCEGYPAGLGPMAGFGYFRQPDYIHWETPFGLSDLAEDRLYEVRSPDGRNVYQLMDASYLVEPEPGLWLLMIDANIFEPLDGAFEKGEEAAFTDSTSGGWNALLRCKPFIIDWIADVRHRAGALGKTLLGFSHYPALDPFDSASGAEGALFGDTNVVRRTPRKAVEDALRDAGLAIHFSGHLHVEGVTRRGDGENALTNIAVPSLVAFPPAFKVVHPSRQEITVETVEMDALPINSRICRGYAQEMVLAGEDEDRVFAADNYGEFLLGHKRALIRHRYFIKEWPAEVVAAVADKTVQDVIGLIGKKGASISDGLALASELPMFELIADWYCLRQGAGLALTHIRPERLSFYRVLAERFGREADRHDGSVQSFIEIFFGALGLFLERAEGSSRDLTLQFAPQYERVAV